MTTSDVRRVDLLGDRAGGQLEQKGVHPAHEPGAVVADVAVALGQKPQDFAVANGLDRGEGPGSAAP
jgi:hypothetical protein